MLSLPLRALNKYSRWATTTGMWKRRLTELIRKYGIRAMFHLPSAYIGRNGHVTANETPSLYRDFEVSHAMINQMPFQQRVQEVWEDLLAWGHRRLPGSLAFLSLWRIHPTASAIANPSGHSYARTTQSTTLRTARPGNPVYLERHLPLHRAFAVFRVSLLKKHPGNVLLYVWGNSFEFEREHNWDLIQEFCKRMQDLPEIWYATYIEVADYCTARKRIVISAGGAVIQNLSYQDILLSVNGQTVSDSGGKIVVFRK